MLSDTIYHRRSWPPFVWGARIYWTYSDFLNSFPTNEVDLHIIKCQRGPRPLPVMFYEDASSMSVDPASIPGLVPQQQQSGGVLDNVPQLRDKPWFVSWLMLSFIDLLNITRFKTAIQTLQGGKNHGIINQGAIYSSWYFYGDKFLIRKTYIVYFLNSTLDKWIESISNFQ